MRQSCLPGYVDHSCDAHRRIGHEPNRGRAGAGGAQLEHVIDDDDRLTEIDQNVVNSLANGPRRESAIDGAKDSQPPPCQGLLDGEASAVQPLERIVWRGRCSGIAGNGDKHHRHGGDQSRTQAPRRRTARSWIDEARGEFEQCHHQGLISHGPVSKRMNLACHDPWSGHSLLWSPTVIQSSPRVRSPVAAKRATNAGEPLDVI
jgi:hypothetical protein